MLLYLAVLGGLALVVWVLVTLVFIVMGSGID
jgi:hypothetical protein